MGENKCNRTNCLGREENDSFPNLIEALEAIERGNYEKVLIINLIVTSEHMTLNENSRKEPREKEGIFSYFSDEKHSDLSLNIRPKK